MVKPASIKAAGKIIDPDDPKLRDRDPDHIRDGIARGDGPIITAAGANGPLYNVQPVDGDTLKTDEARGRIWGADAPELKQQGWNRQGNAVPIGQHSRDFLQGAVNNATNVQLGNVEGMSNGQPVGPVTLDGRTRP